MNDSYSAVRERLHRKSHDYFVFSYGRWDDAMRRMFYGATDALLDASEAAASYKHLISSNALSSNTRANLLVCHGFLQALYVQQDAVITLSSAVGLKWSPSNDRRLAEIRDARNRLTGHPALAGKNDKSRRLSSAIIPYDYITQRGFRGHVYFEDGFEDIEVEVAAFQQDNEQLLSLQMLLVEKKMDEQERQFRTKQAAQPLSSFFERPFDYLLQRLHCDLSDEGRVGQAHTHAGMIRERLKALEKEIKDRGFEREIGPFEILFTGLSLLEGIINRGSCSEIAQQEFDLIYDGLEKNFTSLRTNLSAIDEKIRAPIR